MREGIVRIWAALEGDMYNYCKNTVHMTYLRCASGMLHRCRARPLTTSQIVIARGFCRFLVSYYHLLHIRKEHMVGLGKRVRNVLIPLQQTSRLLLALTTSTFLEPPFCSALYFSPKLLPFSR